MKQFLLVFQIITSVSLVVLILLQAKGVGLGKAWGGGGEFYKSRRGVEKLLFRFTILMAGLFLVLAVLNLLVS